MKVTLFLPFLVALTILSGIGIAFAQIDTARATLCSDLTGATNPIVRVAVPGGAVPNGSVFCQFIAANGTFLRSSFEIADPNLLSLGIVQAVDIFGITLSGGFTNTSFNSPVQVCLQGSGTYYYLDARQSPRTTITMFTTSEGGYTCASIPGPGTTVLVSSAPPPAAPAATAAPGAPAAPAAPGAPAVPGIAATPTLVPGGIQDLTDLNCTGRTTRIVRLRAEPNTTSPVIATLAFNLSLRITGVADGWYRVVYLNGQGWISAQFFRPTAGCGV
jgi:hypothetical protein